MFALINSSGRNEAEEEMKQRKTVAERFPDYVIFMRKVFPDIAREQS